MSYKHLIVQQVKPATNTTKTNITTPPSTNKSPSVPGPAVVVPSTPVYDVLNNTAFNVVVVFIAAAASAITGSLFWAFWLIIKNIVILTGL